MAVFLSPVGGAAVQFFDNSGQVLTGGLLYTYLAGTTTPAATYTSNTGTQFHTNPIILDASGRIPNGGEVWLAQNIQYKFVLKDSNSVLIGTWDNIIGINSNFLNYNVQEETQTATQGQTVFTLATISYTPATNTLIVYVNGSKQIPVINYVETDATTVTFLTGLNVGDVVNFTTAISLSTGVTSADLVTYTPAGIDAVVTNVQDKLRQTVSVIDFGADPTGVSDSHTAFVNAIATAGTVYVPKGTYNIGLPIVCTNPFKLVGDGISSTVIQRNFSPTVDTDGIFTIQQGGTEICMRDMTLRSLTGQTGGCLVSIVPSVSGGMGLYNFSNIDFTTTGTSTHQYTLYFDGTAANTGGIGIRGLDMFGCSVFGGGVSSILVKGVLKFSFIGGGVYGAGGSGTSNVRFDGTSAVPTSSFLFTPADCSVPISFNYATVGRFGCGLMGAITNTTNTSFITGFGYSVNVEQNWNYSIFEHTQYGLFLSEPEQGITNYGGAAITGSPQYAIQMVGAVTGGIAGAVTQIGQIGVGYETACPTGKTFSFTNQYAILFTISSGAGGAALVFTDYLSSSVTLVANPSSLFQATSTPVAGYTGIYKVANSNVINVVNNTGSTAYYNILSVGQVLLTTDPA